MMDASIILQGQAPNIMGAISGANDAAQNQLGYQRQREIEQLYKTQGAGMLAGDPNAMNALVGYDPAAAQGLQQNQLGMDATRLGMDATRQNMAFSAEEMQMKRDEGKAAAARHLQEQAATLTAAQLAAEGKALEDGLKGAASFYQKGDKAGYDQWLQQHNLDPAQYAFEQFPAHAAMFEGVLEAFKTFAPPEPKGPMSPEGKFAADQSAGLLPPGAKPAPGVQVTNNMGEGNKFYEELDKGQATMFQTLMSEGVTAGRTKGQIDRLDGLLSASPTGMGAAFTQFAGEYGIDLGGLDEIQAAQAIINQIVPQQRQPGTGPMSDADLALFKQSVPRLINQPGGNKIIIEAMRGVAEYTRQQSEIASKVADRTMTPAEGRAALNNLVNPLDGIGKASGAPKVETGAPARLDDQGPTQADWDKAYEQLPSGTVFVGPDGVKRTKP